MYRQIKCTLCNNSCVMIHLLLFVLSREFIKRKTIPWSFSIMLLIFVISVPNLGRQDRYPNDTYLDVARHV